MCKLPHWCAQVDLEVPPEVKFRLHRLAVLAALARADVPEAQRLTANVLGPLAEAHASLQPQLQQTMQWFMQTVSAAVRGILQSETSSAMLALSSHFSGLSSPAKRATPDATDGPMPPPPTSMRSDEGPGAAAGSAAAAAGPSTSAAAALHNPEQAGSPSTPAEDAGTVAVRGSRLVSLLQAGVFVYASWYRRNPGRRRAPSDPCGAALGLHELLHGGLEAALEAMQMVDGGDRNGSGDGPGPGTRARLMAQEWGAPR